MKTIFTLLACTIFTLASIANEGTRLTISTITDNNLKVEVDGRRYNIDNKGIFIRDLRTGSHTVKIYRDKKNNNRWKIFGIGFNKQEIVYDNRVNLRNGYHLDILINRFGRVLIDERRIDRNDEWYKEDDDDRYDRDRDQDNRDSHDNRDNRDTRYDNNSRIMSDYDFNQVKERLQREWFENSRVTTAKQVFDQNYFLSRQVKELLQLFSFENNKLDLAKYAYGRTTDKAVYYIVNDVFAFNRSKEELANYIRDYR